MSLFGFIGEQLARGKVNAARKGKEGQDAMKVIGFLDGKKRYLLLLVFAAQAIAELTGHGNIVGASKALLSILGWSPDEAIVSSAVVAQLVACGYAIYDGIRKDRAQRAAAARIVR